MKRSTFSPIATRIIEIELADGLQERYELGDYVQVMALLRYKRTPIGYVRRSCPDGVLHAKELLAAVEEQEELQGRLAHLMLRRWLLGEERAPGPPLSWSVIVCTRDRPEELRRCLDALLTIDQAGGELIVVDNSPSDDRTRELAAAYPVRYLREDKPGLNRARQTGAQGARGEILIYTDDDVVVDAGWVDAILRPFVNPRVAAVTGLTLPLELETEAQHLFERYGGFGRGFRERTFDYTVIPPAAAGMVGAGANMAFRREKVIEMGLFEAELDCGTVARTGGDAYAFYRLLADGYQIVYTPEALVWHRHRRDYRALRRTLAGYSVGGFAFLTRCLLQHGDWQALDVALAWLRSDHLRQLARWLRRDPDHLPLDLVLAQLAACPLGPWAYFASRRDERRRQRRGSGKIKLMEGQGS